MLRNFITATRVRQDVFISAYRSLPGRRTFGAMRCLYSEPRQLTATSVACAGSGDVACFGHSLGGTLALAAELRRPGTFAAMFLYEPVIAAG